MKSIIHFHNNIFVKTAGLVILALLTACYGVQSQFGKNGLTKDKKVCLVGYINSNAARLFVREFYDVFGDHKIPNCDYLIYAMFTESSSRQAPMSGLEYFTSQTFNVMYSVYQFKQDAKIVKQVQDIVDNPTTINHEVYTENFGRGAIASRANNHFRRDALAIRTYSYAYIDNVARFNKVLKNIGGNSYDGSLGTQQNPLVLTAQTQEQEDAYEHIAKNIAQKVINDVVIKIDKHLNPEELDDSNDTNTAEVVVDDVIPINETDKTQKVKEKKKIQKISDVIK